MSALQQLIQQPGEQFADPQPLPSSRPAVQAFDDSLMPDPLRPWIADIAERMQCPPDFPAIGAMVALASVVGRQCAINPKQRDDWQVVPNLWGAIVGRPGQLKTPALKEAMRPLRRLVADADKQYSEELADYEADAPVRQEQAKVAKAMLQKALKSGGAGESEADALRAMQKGSAPPIHKRYECNDTTIEKLAELLRDNPTGILLFRDELVGWLKSLDRDGREGDRTFYLEAWDGNGAIKHDRIGRGTVTVQGVCVSILGGIQPGPLARYIEDAASGKGGSDGLMQRFQLAVFPDDSGNWRHVDRWPDTEIKNRAYQVYRRLAELKLPVAQGVGVSEDGVPALRFTDSAAGLMADWWPELEAKLRSGLPEVLESHLSKYRSLVPSLALLLHLAESNDAAVGVRSLQKAIIWSEYLESHAMRIYAPATAPGGIAAHLLHARIVAGELGDQFTARDVYRKHWHGLDRQAVAGAVELLSDLDHLYPENIDTGGKPATLFHVNPKVMT